MICFRRRSCRCILIPTRFIRLSFWNILIPGFEFYFLFLLIFFSNHVKIILFLPVNLIWLMRICFVILIWFYTWVNPPLVMIDFSFCWNCIIIFSHWVTPSPCCFEFCGCHFDFLKFFCFNRHELIDYLSDDVGSGEAVEDAFRLVNKFLISLCLKFVDVQTSIMVFHELTLVGDQVHGDISLIHLIDLGLFLFFDHVSSKGF